MRRPPPSERLDGLDAGDAGQAPAAASSQSAFQHQPARRGGAGLGDRAVEHLAAPGHQHHRSHSRSACCITWVEKTTVAPRSARSRIMVSSDCWLTGSRPENGSSRMTSSGSCARADEQLDLLRHALGQGLDRPARGLAQALGLQHAIGAPAGLGRWARPSGRRRRRWRRSGSCGGRGRAPPAGSRSGSAPVRASSAPSTRDLARGRLDQAQHHAQGRGLARAVGAEEAEDPAGLGGEAQVPHRLEIAVAFGDAVDDQGLAHAVVAPREAL